MLSDSLPLPALRLIGAMVLGVVIPLTALGEGAVRPLALTLQAAVEQAVTLSRGDARADVAVAFDGEGRVASVALLRSTGSTTSDAAARDAALQLASLEPRGGSSGLTRIYHASFDAAAE